MIIGVVILDCPIVELAASIIPSGYSRLELIRDIVSFKEPGVTFVSLKLSGLNLTTESIESTAFMPSSVPSIVGFRKGYSSRWAFRVSFID
jgi:hypothetical protein